MTALPDYENILAQAREASVRQIEDIFANPEGICRGLTCAFHAKQEHPGAIHPDNLYIGINHNLNNILYILTSISCSPERGDEIIGHNNPLETALAQQILLSIYTPEQKRRIATVLKTTVRAFCEAYRDNSQRTAERLHENLPPHSDSPAHAEWIAQLQQNKINFIDYLVERLEK